jgi:hypothetical protein
METFCNFLKRKQIFSSAAFALLNETFQVANSRAT